MDFSRTFLRTATGEVKWNFANCAQWIFRFYTTSVGWMNWQLWGNVRTPADSVIFFSLLCKKKLNIFRSGYGSDPMHARNHSILSIKNGQLRERVNKILMKLIFKTTQPEIKRRNCLKTFEIILWSRHSARVYGQQEKERRLITRNEWNLYFCVEKKS